MSYVTLHFKTTSKIQTQNAEVHPFVRSYLVQPVECLVAEQGDHKMIKKCQTKTSLLTPNKNCLLSKIKMEASGPPNIASTFDMVHLQKTVAQRQIIALLPAAAPMPSPSIEVTLINLIGHPRPLFNLFLLFQIKKYNFVTNKCENDAYSMRWRDSNSQPLDNQSPLITTRPGLPLNISC